MPFLPVNKDELKKMFKTDTPDFVLVTADAYVDHPSFGIAIISRVLVKAGFSVGIIAAVDYKNKENFMVFGNPKYAFLVSAGNIDSMVNNYSVAKIKRNKDIYLPASKVGSRPDRATIVYSNKIRESVKDAVIIIGGVEASLRRLSHYDYLSDKVRRSILLDASADLLVYGMAESQIVEIANALKSGKSIKEITDLEGTVYRTDNVEKIENYVLLPHFDEVSDKNKKETYAKSFEVQYKNNGYKTARTLVEPYREGFVVQNPPPKPLDTKALDAVYALPYMGEYHPMYEKDGGIAAIEEVKFSLISNRGCFGNCSFCALAFHQGRIVQSRSHESLVNEAKKLVWRHDFKGYIHDVGGPTANFRHPPCEKSVKEGVCVNKNCLSPKPCKNLKISHKDYLSLLKKLREIDGIKKVFIRSGLRYDYIMYDNDDEFLNELCKHHVSGQLKVAPEHVCPDVLNLMGKPAKEIFDKFSQKYYHINNKIEKKQFLVPYLMSGHPGSTLNDAVELALYLRDNNITPEQVQDFYPTPGTLSTAMYYTGINPLTKEKVYVPTSPHEKAMQRALIQYKLPQNERLVKEALIKTGRKDLIGFEKGCLIRPRALKTSKESEKNGKTSISKHKRGKR